jgi:hypothetical protein
MDAPQGGGDLLRLHRRPGRPRERVLHAVSAVGRCALLAAGCWLLCSVLSAVNWPIGAVVRGARCASAPVLLRLRPTHAAQHAAARSTFAWLCCGSRPGGSHSHSHSSRVSCTRRRRRRHAPPGRTLRPAPCALRPAPCALQCSILPWA